MLATCAVMTVASTSFLFFLRVRAIYLKSRYVTALFGLLWIIAIALNTLAAGSLRVGKHQHGLHCDHFAHSSLT